MDGAVTSSTHQIFIEMYIQSKISIPKKKKKNDEAKKDSHLIFAAICVGVGVDLCIFFQIPYNISKNQPSYFRNQKLLAYIEWYTIIAFYFLAKQWDMHMHSSDGVKQWHV